MASAIVPHVDERVAYDPRPVCATRNRDADAASSGPPQRPLPPIEFPDSLPVSARRDDIAAAIAAHQVVIVCGETGSGKTTQLPKIALTLGRGWGAGGRGLIGHTQPRRLAATSVAKRIAQELGSALGEVVGFKVRFNDRLHRGASIKLMTDGILLAETQSDPLLRAYDTIIVDEAHERSLNIDFLLGHLRQILPRRPDLKVIVTSATIDADRFAQHFASQAGPAPVIMVSGRTFPVEIRHRPIEAPESGREGQVAAKSDARPEGRQADARAEGRQDAASRRSARDSESRLHEAIADAVDELWQGAAAGDILVFLPGEREIREAADHLRKHLAAQRRAGPVAEIVPLFARLSQAEQDHVFEPSNGRRIVLATNVAETSLTVPGIRYVIDTGVARVKRYSYRSKVEQLQVEPISQAAANQRAGRCGRVANGICIRLYDELDLAGRPPFTDPEILRSSLAGVILRMKSLGLGSVEDFPFLEAPPRKAIADGYELLGELAAVDEQHELTPVGQSLARLPLDPRIGRMILAAVEHHALHEVLIVASALSVQDVRDRPLDQQQAADAKHQRFDDERSEFRGLLKLWAWIEEGRGVHGHAAAATQAVDTHKLSHRQQELRLREHFISPRRVREWRDIHAQLHTVVAEQGWRLNAAPATDEQFHMALMTGLLGNIGCKSDDDDWYLGARGIKFWRHPGSHLSKKPGRWVMAAELVETTRLFARRMANIEASWIPRVAGHLLKTQLLEPHWEKKAAEVIAFERATLYGVVVYNQRRVNIGLHQPALARELFIREALVQGEWDSKLAFLAHNRRLIREVEALEHKARRQDVLVDEALIEAFYDAHVGAEVVSGATMERWYRAARSRDPEVLMLKRDDLMRHQAAGITSAAFPPTIKLGGIDCAATYLHQPGDTKDGLTVTVPIFMLNQVAEDRCDWLVPGMLESKVLALLKTLPQKPRARLVPLPTAAAELTTALTFGDGALVDALIKAVRARVDLPLARSDLKLDQLPAHLMMNLRVVDEHGRQLGMGRHLPTLKSQLGTQARGAFQALASLRLEGAGVSGGGQGGGAAAAASTTTPAATHGRGQRQPSTEPSRDRSAVGATGGQAPTPVTVERHTAWTFGELPEIMEVRRGAQTLIGFPALIDRQDHVTIEVFDEPDAAAAQHREGLKRLLRLALKEPLRYVEKSLPELSKMAMIFMPMGTADELKAQLIDCALDRAFLQAPLPVDAATFQARLEEGRTRLSLVAQEVARLTATVLGEYATAARKLKDIKASKDVHDDVTAQLAALVHKRFIQQTPWSVMQHLPRYLKAVVLRLDKWKQDPARDAQRLAELRPLQQRHQRKLADLRGVHDARLEEYRWLLEELRVSFFAQELRTPTPVSAKRLDKLWAQISA